MIQSVRDAAFSLKHAKPWPTTSASATGFKLLGVAVEIPRPPIFEQGRLVFRIASIANVPIPAVGQADGAGILLPQNLETAALLLLCLGQARLARVRTPVRKPMILVVVVMSPLGEARLTRKPQLKVKPVVVMYPLGQARPTKYLTSSSHDTCVILSFFLSEQTNNIFC